MNAQINLFDEIVVDNFAGGGGASTGIELAIGRPVDIAINHDPQAILMHKTNHPYTKHYCESVWDVDPIEICKGRKVGLMWLSPDCKHFSRAKGNKPVDTNIRGLAWIAVRWAISVKPRVIILENVPEFITWGPLGGNNKPDMKKQGITFISFVKSLEHLGYKVEWKKLKACDYGAPTIRERFFLVARCDGQPIVFPKPTHGEGLIPYRTAAECINWDIPCKSIFERKKPLVENTMRRIARGLDKFTLKADKPFIIPIGYGENKGQKPRVHDIDKPLSTVVSTSKQYLVTPSIQKYFKSGVGSRCDSPLGTIKTKEHQAIICPTLVASHLVSYYKGDHYSSVDSPLATITTMERHGIIKCRLKKYDSNTNLGYWAEIRTMLNKYCDYWIKDDEVLLLNINGKDFFINDIGMRMFEPRELYNAQGFPPDYIIDHDYKGNEYKRKHQIARCGNAVPPPFAEALVRANCPELCGNKIKTMEQLHQEIAV